MMLWLIGAVLALITGVLLAWASHRDALDQMYLIVLPSDAREAYETGEQEPIDFPTTTSGG